MTISKSKMTNPIIGYKLKMDQIFTEADVVPVTWISIEDVAGVELKAGDIINKISSVSKGKGFQGVVKRHGFHGGPKTHGQKNRLRAPGSIGSTGPQRVMPGRKMAGRMGNDRKTLKKIEILEWSDENKMLAIKGSVAGRRGSKVQIYL
ncbi:MAG: 50S ribosomal protein L3 [Candidatus Colwellbacteria bacterium]|nr:50S ribosomal protein L3 [Candidatus Colwellbacteria bacterium]